MTRWWLYTGNEDLIGCNQDAGWLSIDTPGPNDDWHGEIPFDGKPSPTFPVTLNFGKFSSGLEARNEFRTDHVGFWINHVPLYGIPTRDDPLRQSFLDWAASDNAYHNGKPFALGLRARGCLVKDGDVVIPTNASQDDIFAAIEIVGTHTAVLHGYVWGWDFLQRVRDHEIRSGCFYGYYPLEDIERW